MNTKERIAVVRAMELLARSVKDEEVFEDWLYNGVADGDIDENTIDEDLIDYVDNDAYFADLMRTFLVLMYNARKSGGLYVDEVVSS